MTLRVMLAGQEAAGGQLLRILSELGHEVVAVLTDEPATKGAPSSLAAIAQRAQMAVLPAKLVRDPAFASRIRDLGVDLLLNVHSLHIIADDVLTAPRTGSFNLHPGPLPQYAGLNTVGWAIYNGDAEYGVTVHWMVPRIDAGPIALEDRFPIRANDTALTLSAECTRRGVALMVELLRLAALGPDAIPSRPQDISSRRYYTRHSVPGQGRVDWNRPSAELARFTRAFDYGPFASPWGRAYMYFRGSRIDVMGLTPTGQPADQPAGAHRLVDGFTWIAAADEWMKVGKLFFEGAPLDPVALDSLKPARTDNGDAA